MDLRGYGASDKTPRGYDPHTTAYDVSGVIKSLGFGSAVVVGHDWGGMAAWATLAYAAGPVRGLVSVAAPHPLAFPWRADLAGLALAQLPLVAEHRIMAREGAFVERLLRSRAADGPGCDGGRGHSTTATPSAVAGPAVPLEYQRTSSGSRSEPAAGSTAGACASRSRCRCCRSTARPTGWCH